MDEVRRYKRKRHLRAHAKSKNGCKVCKTRRVKCDETKPSCVRCTNLGVQCTYIPPKTWLFEPKQAAKQENEQVHQPMVPSSLSISDKALEDRRAFLYFRERTAPRFSWTSPVSKDFFERFIPQIAVSELVIWDVVVAMATKQEEYSCTDEGRAERCRSEAMIRHGKAISTLAKPGFARIPDIAVLGALLLGAYYNMVEDSGITGVEHMVHAQRMLHEMSRSKPTSDQIFLRSCTSAMMTELALVTSAYGRPPKSAQIIMPATERAPHLPSTFSSLLEAKRTLYDIFRYRIYAMAQDNLSQEVLAAAHTEESLTRWYLLLRQFKASCPSTNNEALAAGHMLFQSKLWCMGLSPANSAFVSQNQIQVRSVDLSDRNSVVVTALLPGGPYPSLVDAPRSLILDELDIWPRVVAVSTVRPGTMVTITVSR